MLHKAQKALLIKLGEKLFGVSRSERIYDKVAGFVQQWKNTFENAGVPEKEIEQLTRSNDRRCN